MLETQVATDSPSHPDAQSVKSTIYVMKVSQLVNRLCQGSNPQITILKNMTYY